MSSFGGFLLLFTHRFPGGAEKLSEFKPNVFEIFLSSLEKIEDNYFNNYLPLIKDRKFSFKTKSFYKKERRYNVVLTSPPMGTAEQLLPMANTQPLPMNGWALKMLVKLIII